MISDEKIAQLRDLYESGERVTRAAANAGVAFETAHKYFTRFAEEGCRRGSRPPRQPLHGRFWGARKYDGPSWIG